jgi:hypothetical protein
MSQAGSNNAQSNPAIPLQFTTDDGTIAVPIANNLNVLGTIGCATYATAGTVNIKVTANAYDWSEEIITFTAAVQHGYYCNAALTVNLPTTGTSGPLVVGDTVIIYVDTASAVIIKAAAGQIIQNGSASSSVAGTFTSTAAGCILELNYKPSDTTWHALTSVGSWTPA